MASDASIHESMVPRSAEKEVKFLHIWERSIEKNLLLREDISLKITESTEEK